MPSIGEVPDHSSPTATRSKKFHVALTDDASLRGFLWTRITKHTRWEKYGNFESNPSGRCVSGFPYLIGPTQPLAVSSRAAARHGRLEEGGIVCRSGSAYDAVGPWRAWQALQLEGLAWGGGDCNRDGREKGRRIKLEEAGTTDWQQWDR